MKKTRLLRYCNLHLHTISDIQKDILQVEEKVPKNGIDGLQDKSRKPHNIQPGKVTKEIEQEILDLRITKRFGCNRIRFRLKRLKEISLSTKEHLQDTEKTWIEHTEMQNQK